MKAVVVHEKGGPEQLVVEEVADPTPGDSDLLVDVSAAGLNYIDTYHALLLYPWVIFGLGVVVGGCRERVVRGR